MVWKSESRYILLYLSTYKGDYSLPSWLSLVVLNISSSSSRIIDTNLAPDIIRDRGYEEVVDTRKLQSW